MWKTMKRMAKAYGHLTVLGHTILIVVPLVAFTGILLGLVYVHEWTRRHSPIDGLPLDSGWTSNLVYVEYKATSLILVASWSSSVAVPFIGSLLVLSSYAVAADLVWSSQRSFRAFLPTPTQLGILTDLLDSKKLVLLLWLRAFWRRDNKKMLSRWMLEFPAVVSIAGLGLSLALVLCDTWLHIATTSVTRQYLKSIDDPEQEGQAYLYSRQLREGCEQSSPTYCSVRLDSETANVEFPDTIASLLDGSAPDTDIMLAIDGSYILAPRLRQYDESSKSSELGYQNFTASTLTVTALCDQNLSSCDAEESRTRPGEWSFRCSAGFSGKITNSSRMSLGSWAQLNGSYAAMRDYYEGFDRIEFGVATVLSNVTLTGTGRLSSNGTSSFAITRCDMTVRSESYLWSNASLIGSTTPDKEADPDSVATSVARQPLLAGYFNSTSFGQNKQAAIMEQMSLSYSAPQTVSDRNIVPSLQSMVGFVGASLLGGTFEAVPATKLLLPDSVIVTQIRKDALFTLVILNTWYAGFAILLCCLALYTLRDPNTRQDIIDVQKLLTVNGLATATVLKYRGDLSMEDPDLRIGVEKVNGKWQFRFWSASDASETKGLLADDEVGAT